MGLRERSEGVVNRIEEVNIPKAGGEELRQFAVYSDSRNVGFGPNLTHRRILTQINNYHYDFICHLGDFVFWDLGWRSFFDDIRAVGLKAPLYPVRGNHDDPLVYRALFGKNAFDYVILYKPNLAIFTLDDNRGYLKPGQLKRFEDRLKRFNGYKWKILMMHKPIYSATNGGVRKMLINKLEPLLKKYRVQAVIGSHFHSYERLFHNGIWHIVTAGGGAPLAKKHLELDGLMVHRRTYNFLIVKVSDMVLEIVAYDIDNSPVDSLKLDSLE